jgi:hypothetical protein
MSAVMASNRPFAAISQFSITVTRRYVAFGSLMREAPPGGKALRVLGHAAFFKPVHKVLHCAAPRRRSLGPLRHDTRPTL